MSHEVWCEYCGEDQRDFSGPCCEARKQEEIDTENELWAFEKVALKILRANRKEIEAAVKVLAKCAKNNQQKNMPHSEDTWRHVRYQIEYEDY